MKTIITPIILFAVIIIASLSSCSEITDNYTYKWEVAIVYTNGEKDTINCQYNSFNGNDCFIFLQTSIPGILSDTPTAPCIVMGCGFYTQTVTCGVRKYEILSTDKILLNKNNNTH